MSFSSYSCIMLAITMHPCRFFGLEHLHNKACRAGPLGSQWVVRHFLGQGCPLIAHNPARPTHFQQSLLRPLLLLISPHWSLYQPQLLQPQNQRLTRRQVQSLNQKENQNQNLRENQNQSRRLRLSLSLSRNPRPSQKVSLRLKVSRSLGVSRSRWRSQLCKVEPRGRQRVTSTQWTART